MGIGFVASFASLILISSVGRIILSGHIDPSSGIRGVQKKSCRQVIVTVAATKIFKRDYVTTDTFRHAIKRKRAKVVDAGRDEPPLNAFQADVKMIKIRRLFLCSTTAEEQILHNTIKFPPAELNSNSLTHRSRLDSVDLGWRKTPRGALTRSFIVEG